MKNWKQTPVLTRAGGRASSGRAGFSERTSAAQMASRGKARAAPLAGGAAAGLPGRLARRHRQTGLSAEPVNGSDPPRISRRPSARPAAIRRFRRFFRPPGRGPFW